ncbi:hypothetical protein K7X08_036103 [Anisodus acutangulus]|uniref:Uncharacterized protein n=1 Tax=Anisodus acutangulus TaxID=402998 RepID=A0A9Q1L4K7_9SOLA|nr:hypothetical protein K7X08_036103 [Anisodus acutangulus]
MSSSEKDIARSSPEITTATSSLEIAIETAKSSSEIAMARSSSEKMKSVGLNTNAYFAAALLISGRMSIEHLRRATGQQNMYFLSSLSGNSIRATSLRLDISVNEVISCSSPLLGLLLEPPLTYSSGHSSEREGLEGYVEVSMGRRVDSEQLSPRV